MTKPARTQSALRQSARTKVLFFAPTLETGGAERVIVEYMNHAVRIDPVLALQYRRGPLLAEIGPGIPVVRIEKKPRSLSRLHRWARRHRRRWRVRMRACSRAVRERIKSLMTEERIAVIQEWEFAVRDFLRLTPPPAAAEAEWAPRSGWKVWLDLPSWALFLFHQARMLAEESREQGADTIVSFLPFTNAIAVLAKIRYRRDLRVVINVHSNKSRLLATLGAYERFCIGNAMKLLYHRADRVIAVSGGIRDDLVAHYRVPEKLVEVVHNPVAVDRIRARGGETVTDCFPSQEFTLVAVGRLVRLKAYHRLIEAVAELGDLRIRVVLIGDGPERDRLRRQAADAGLSERVHFFGYQTNPWKFMRTADALVLSSDVEGLPNVIGEALALGVPVVATDCCRGVSEYLGDSEFGLIVPAGDSSALAAGIRAVLTDRAMSDGFRARAAARIAPFDLGPAVRQFESVVLGCESVVPGFENVVPGEEAS
ncbi:MAG: glycosyltransferase [Gemmatimonadetes bacterium]|nr:glycosyltransferase [Gemmatimonadota bacterium]